MKGTAFNIRARLSRLRERAWSRRGFGSERGDAIVELAVFLAILGIPLLFGTAEMGQVVYGSIEISNAAHAGAMYGMQSATFASDTTGMTTAAQAEASDYGTLMTVTPTTFYACSASLSGTRYTTQSAANSACSGSGNHALQFVQVVTSIALSPKIHIPGIPSSFTVSSTAVMEVEE